MKIYNRDLGIKIISNHNKIGDLFNKNKNISYHLYGDFLSYKSCFYEIAVKLYKENNVYVHVDSIYDLTINDINEFNSYKSIIFIEYNDNFNDVNIKNFILPSINRLCITVKDDNIENLVYKLGKILTNGYYKVNGYYPFIDIDITSFVNPENDAKNLIEHMNCLNSYTISLWDYIFYNQLDLIYKIEALNVLLSYKDVYITNESTLLYFNNKKYFMPLDFNEFCQNKYNCQCDGCNISMFCNKDMNFCSQKQKFYNVFASYIIKGDVRRKYA